MSKKTKSTKPASKAASKPVSNPTQDTTAADKARAAALAGLNANAAGTPPARPTAATGRSAPKASKQDQSARNAKPARNAEAASRSASPKRAASKRLSALDAAAQVLASLPAKEARTGLGAHELIERMAAKGLWTSPGGKTPAATLYAAITREITAKGTASRFARADAGTEGSRGRFVARRAKP